jgi:hypothetical protein
MSAAPAGLHANNAASAMPESKTLLNISPIPTTHHGFVPGM